jgi:hypothetical protein
MVAAGAVKLALAQALAAQEKQQPRVARKRAGNLCSD